MRHFTSRKFVGYVITGGTLAVAALVVKNGNYPALATALVALYGTFAAGNVVAGLKGKDVPEDTAK